MPTTPSHFLANIPPDPSTAASHLFTTLKTLYSSLNLPSKSQKNELLIRIKLIQLLQTYTTNWEATEEQLNKAVKTLN